MTTRDEATGLRVARPAQSEKPGRKQPPSHAQVPPAAWWLAALGAIPFVFLALAGPFLEAPYQERSQFALAAYGAVILSFLGGIHWGLAIAGAGPIQGNGTTSTRLGVSVVPSLVAWGALLLPITIGLLVLALAILGQLLFDLHASSKTWTPAWYPKLRWPLTTVVTASLMLAVLT